MIRRSSALLLHSPLESLHLPRGVHQTLLAGEEGVTAGAYVHTQLCLCGARLPTVPATAGDGCFLVIWMNSGLHDPISSRSLLCYENVDAFALTGGVVKHH